MRHLAACMKHHCGVRLSEYLGGISAMTRNSKIAVDSTQLTYLPLITGFLTTLMTVFLVRDIAILGSDYTFLLGLYEDTLLILILTSAVLSLLNKIPADRANLMAFVCLVAITSKSANSVLIIGNTVPLFNVSLLVLVGSLCMLSLRYYIVWIVVIFLTWGFTAIPRFETFQLLLTGASILIATGFGAFVMRKRINDIIRVALLEETLSTVLPMCSNCKNIKIDQENWGNVADYLETKVEGTHVTREICPTCRHLLYGEFITAQK